MGHGNSTRPAYPTLLGALALLLLALAGPAQAADAGDRQGAGAAVGAPIPHNLAVQDQHGALQNFPSLKRKQGLLLFSRSLDW